MRTLWRVIGWPPLIELGCWFDATAIGRCGPAILASSGPSWSEPDPEIDITLASHVTAESPLALLDGFTGLLPIALLLTSLGPRPKGIGWTGDVVLRAIVRDLPDTGLPYLTHPRSIWALTEGGSYPSAGCVQLALSEGVADFDLLLGELPDRTIEPIALGTYLARIAQLAPEMSELCGHGVELANIGGQSAGELGPLDSVGIMLASEPPP